MTGNIARFLNENVLGFDLFKAVKPPGPPVVYLSGDPSEAASWLADRVSQMIERGECTAEDVFVLTPTVKGGTAHDPTPVNALVNLLSRRGIKVCATHLKTDYIDDDLIKNSVVATTFHKARPFLMLSPAALSICWHCPNLASQLMCAGQRA